MTADVEHAASEGELLFVDIAKTGNTVKVIGEIVAEGAIEMKGLVLVLGGLPGLRRRRVAVVRPRHAEVGDGLGVAADVHGRERVLGSAGSADEPGAGIAHALLAEKTTQHRD